MDTYEQEQMERVKKTLKKVVWGVLGVIALILVLGSFYTVDAGERGLVLRFGEVKSVEAEGLHWKIPVVESVKKFDIREDKVERQSSASSKDLQIVTAQLAVNYEVEINSVELIYTKYKTRNIAVSKIIDPIIQDVVKATTAEFTAEELITKRAEVKDKMEIDIRERVDGTGITITRVNIVNFEFSTSFDQAIEAKVTAEQNALKAQNDLARIEFEAQQKIETAKADAEAIRIQAEAVNSQGGADFVELQRIQKWNGQACTSYCGLDASTGLLINRN